MEEVDWVMVPQIKGNLFKFWDAQSSSHTLISKTDRSLLGSNSNGQLGDGTTTDRHTPVQILSGAQMNPKALIINTGTGGTVSGAASYDFNSTATITATPSAGYLFSNWSGPVASTSSNPTTVNMAYNREVNAC